MLPTLRTRGFFTNMRNMRTIYMYRQGKRVLRVVVVVVKKIRLRHVGGISILLYTQIVRMLRMFVKNPRVRKVGSMRTPAHVCACCAHVRW